MEYEIIVTSVHDRADLLDRTLRSMLPRLDMMPTRLIVHEDARADRPVDAGRTEALCSMIKADFGVPVDLLLTRPGTGMGMALKRLLAAAHTEFVLYTQEDFDFLRPIPVAECLAIMARHELHHVRFNKRKTMKTKGADRPPHEQFHKVEVQYEGLNGPQTFCISDHWYFQASLWRRSIAKEGFDTLAATAPAGGTIPFPEMAFNRWYNTRGGDVHMKDPKMRQERLRTFIWGGIGEPAFIKHTGGERRTHTLNTST